MLLVKTKMGKSRIHGNGLFAGQLIKKGQPLWRYEPTIDKKISPGQLGVLPRHTQQFVKYYSYRNKQGAYVFCGDNARYINHSDRPNTTDLMVFRGRRLGGEGITVAVRDIKKGEEITSRYLWRDKRGWHHLQC